MCVIRNYQVGDEKDVLIIIEEALAAYGLKTDLSSTDADIQNIESAYITRGGAFRILVQDKHIVGCCGLYPFAEDTFEIRKMYLRPSMKGQGLGRMMMNDCLEQAKTLGIKRLILETNACLHEAVAMYTKYGFTEYVPKHLSSRCSMGMELVLT